MRTRNAVLMGAAVTGAGTLFNVTRRKLNRALMQRRRSIAWRRRRSILGRAGIAAAVAGVTVGTFAAIRGG